MRQLGVNVAKSWGILAQVRVAKTLPMGREKRNSRSANPQRHHFGESPPLRPSAESRESPRMRTQYYTATSLDGFIATEDDSLEWLFPLGDLNDSSYPNFIARVGALAMGSSTYEWMLRNADKVAEETGSNWPYAQPTWVFTSRKLTPINGADIHFVQGDVRPVHEAMRLAANGKNVWIVGGGDLAGQFYDAGLLDDLFVQVGSVTLGKGKPLFPRRVLSPKLRLIAARQVNETMLDLHYEVRNEH